VRKPFLKEMKRIVVVAVSLGVFLADGLRRVFDLLVGKRMPAAKVVLYYHSVPEEQRAAFARQMDRLLLWAEPSRADAPILDRPGARYAAVTFDDGYQNIVDNALPELAKRGIPATIFIVAGALGVTPNWEDYSGGFDLAIHELIMSAEQLRALPSNLVQIGSHTRTHPMLVRLSEQQVRLELSTSRRMLEEIIGREVKLFSFPYGSFNTDVIACCREAGYERIFTTAPLQACCGTDPFIVGRVTVNPDDSLLEFRLKVHGAYRWLPVASRVKRTLISAGEKRQAEESPPHLTR
jgi:peptidoglycan/xylan/chitin deacetylase (PgdA/CDA1 family)